MKEASFFCYLEQALKNLHAGDALRFNIEGEVKRLMKLYSEEEICEKVKEVTFKGE
ncbi:hypothetical protein [Enterococcus sp. AZ173]|uniref:hypothetical protein n=1 Tax=Enterococcus sp. AZ173 TaxID=2774700 RepID=UPI003D2C896D